MASQNAEAGLTREPQAENRRTSIGSQRNPASEEAILQAAQDILLEGGLPAFSIGAVARRAKAGKPTIYHWWPSRAALLLDLAVPVRATRFLARRRRGDIPLDHRRSADRSRRATGAAGLCRVQVSAERGYPQARTGARTGASGHRSRTVDRAVLEPCLEPTADQPAGREPKRDRADRLGGRRRGSRSKIGVQ